MSLTNRKQVEAALDEILALHQQVIKARDGRRQEWRGYQQAYDRFEDARRDFLLDLAAVPLAPTRTPHVPSSASSTSNHVG